MDTSISIALGTVRHRRLRPVARAFSYGAFYLRLPMRVNGVTLSPQGHWWFAINRFALLGFKHKDHGDRASDDALPWLFALLDKANVHCDGNVYLHTFPSVLGFSFKPVSFWFCHDAQQALIAIVCEVHNTFGEQHCYVLRHADERSGQSLPIKPAQLFESNKQFHVSPFFPVSGGYRFRFLNVGSGLVANSVARIDYVDEGADLLTTSLSGAHEPLNAVSACKAFFRYPLFSLGVVARIHWQALKLLLNRVRFHAKPKPPIEAFTASLPPTKAQ